MWADHPSIASADAPGQVGRWFSSRSIAAAVALAAIVAAVYWPARAGGFIWDDNDFLADNPLNRDLRGLWAIWTSFAAMDYWPLTNSAFWVEWQLWGIDPRGYHAVSVGLHVTVALLLVAVLRRLGARAAWVSAAIFAVHPVNVESVAWIAQQKTLLATCLLFVSALFWLQARVTAAAWSTRDSLALAAYACALAAKTSVVTFPLALVGHEWFAGRTDRRALARTVPFFLAALVGGMLTLACNAAHGTGVVHDRGAAERLATAFTAGWFYLGKAFLPLDPCFVYPRWTTDPRSLAGWLPAIAWLVLLAGLVASRRAWCRPMLAGLGWFLVMLAPASGIVDIYFLSYSPVADHYQYQSLSGVIAAAVHILAAGWSRPGATRTATGTLALVVFCGFAAAARERCTVYVDAETLWRDTLRLNPRSELALNNLGAILRDRGEHDRAIACFRDAVQIGGQSAATAVADTNLRGLVALRAYRSGNLLETVRELDALVSADHFPHRHLTPAMIAALLNLRGRAAARLGDESKALESYRASLHVLPTGNPEAVSFIRHPAANEEAQREVK